MASCDVNTLLSQAGCFSCLSSEAREILRLQLLCAISTGVISGSGTINTLAKFTAAKVLGNSLVTDDGTTVTVGGLLAVSASSNAAAVTVSGYSITGANAQSLVDLSGTWNTTGTPTAIKLNVTDTASNAASNFLNFQTSSVTKYRVQKDGSFTAGQFSTAGFYGLDWNASNGQLRSSRSAGGTIIFTMDTGANALTIGVVIANSGLQTGLNSSLVTSNVAMLNGAGVGAGTITNAPATGNPTKWIPIVDNGTTRYVPAW